MKTWDIVLIVGGLGLVAYWLYTGLPQKIGGLIEGMANRSNYTDRAYYTRNGYRY